ncbi:TPA: hypothetical protein EYH33_04440 [Candidatus Bipolaricaulota bacterium]|nr:hypothetical protein [Candidatus Bipolaricaulota bacterium]
MKRVLLVAVVLVGLAGSIGLAQCGGCPPPERPPCYTSFWVGEPVQIELKVSYGFCCCCYSAPQVLGWRVETWPDGVTVYSEAFAAPVAASAFSVTWDQLDATGAQVAAGYYKVVVVTTAGEYEAYLRLVERPQGCCFWPWLSSRPCAVSLCQPRVILSRPCVSPCQIRLFVSPCCP